MKCANQLAIIPVNPRLPFGVPLAEVCHDHDLHPGLRDLFLKSYLNTTDQNDIEDTLYDNYIHRILSLVPNGQGTLDDRLSLKEQLENGQFIISLKCPAGAPIWVLRHFLGRLPKPLLYEFNERFPNANKHSWLDIANECRDAIKMTTMCGHSLDQLKMKLAAIIMQLEKANFLVLSALMGLIRNLAAGNVVHTKLNKRVVFTLTCYFTQCITSRPFRPGIATVKDRRYYPLILFLIYYWCDIRHLVNKLTSRVYLEHLTADRPRMCDSLPNCIDPQALAAFGQWDRDKRNKTNSLQNDRTVSQSETQEKAINMQKLNITEKEKSGDTQRKSQNKKSIDKNKSIQTENQIVSKVIPLTYKCCNCHVMNTIETNIYIDANQCPEENNLLYINKNVNQDNEYLQKKETKINNVGCTCNDNRNNLQHRTCIGFCTCSDKSACVSQSHDYNHNHLSDIKEASQTKSIKSKSTHSLASRNSSDHYKIGNDETKRNGSREYLPEVMVPTLDTLTEEDTPRSSIIDTSASTSGSSTTTDNSPRRILQKFHIKQLRSTFRMFTSKGKTHKSNSDELITYAKVKYKKIFNSITPHHE